MKKQEPKKRKKPISYYEKRAIKSWEPVPEMDGDPEVKAKFCARLVNRIYYYNRKILMKDCYLFRVLMMTPTRVLKQAMPVLESGAQKEYEDWLVNMQNAGRITPKLLPPYERRFKKLQALKPIK